MKRAPAPPPGSDDWDDLGRPTAGAPKSPVWKRWRISYDADLERFERRARDLDELRKNADGRRRGGRRPPIVRTTGEGTAEGVGRDGT